MIDFTIYMSYTKIYHALIIYYSVSKNVIRV